MKEAQEANQMQERLNIIESTMVRLQNEICRINFLLGQILNK